MNDGGRGGEALRRRDEILQVLYWMQGEGLGDGAGPDDLRRLLARPGDGDGGRDGDLERDLAALEGAGLVRRAADGTVRLTEAGRREGGRRFADAFSGLTAQAHGECSDPLCDCHHDPEAALECRRARFGAGAP